MQGGQSIAVFNEFLSPADQVHVLQQHLDLAADQQALEGRVFDVDVGNIEFFQFDRLLLDTGEHRLHIVELPPHRERKGHYRTFHAFQRIDTQEMNQAFFAVCLPKKPFSALQLRAVFLVISVPLVRQHVAQRCIGSQIQPSYLQVDFVDGGEFPRQVHVRLYVDRLQTLRKAAGLRYAVILLQMAARACDGESIQQHEVVEPQHLDQA